MPSAPFHFKQFVIHQDRCAMKVGTDAVLLGSWVKVGNAHSILDIGTGTGIVALMLAQKTDASIDAIEIDKNAYEQAAENVCISPWSQQISVMHTSLQEFVGRCGRKYDCIVSNPPYFIDAYKPASAGRIAARHTDSHLSFDDLISGVMSLLLPEGSFSLILPSRESLVFMEMAKEAGLFCNSILNVRTREGKSVKRLLMMFGKKETCMTLEEMSIQDRDMAFSDEYIRLTSEYYIGLKKNHRKPFDEVQSRISSNDMPIEASSARTGS
jgi:tRNA1Val (adenine37-N6)-methyltransferase